jgi:hypothetical protein
MNRRRLRGLWRLAVAAAAIALPAAAWAQTAQVRYERALAEEQALRAGDPSPASLRAAARAFEAIALRYPVSGYSDNALWQGAGLHLLAHEKSGQAADRREAERLLAWLVREYPSSSLKRQATTMLADIATPPATDPPRAAAPVEAGTPATVRRITHSPLPRGDRIIVELSHEAAYIGDRVDGPDRVFFDFTNAAPAVDAAQPVDALAGTFVKHVRVGRPTSGVGDARRAGNRRHAQAALQRVSALRAVPPGHRRRVGRSERCPRAVSAAAAAAAPRHHRPERRRPR